jgi:hypothetical protein
MRAILICILLFAGFAQAQPSIFAGRPGGVATTAAITGGTIDGTAIGGTTPAAGAFTTLSATTRLAFVGNGSFDAVATNISFAQHATRQLGIRIGSDGQVFEFNSARLGVGSGMVYSWNSASTFASGSLDTGLARISAGTVGVGTGAAGSVAGTLALAALTRGTQVTISATAPTIASGGCTAPAVTWNNGTAAFLITIGTSCAGVKTVVLTMPAATNLWVCKAENNTSDAAQQTNVIASRATSTTAVVLTSYDRTTGLQEDFTASDTLLVSCMGG